MSAVTASKKLGSFVFQRGKAGLQVRDLVLKVLGALFQLPLFFVGELIAVHKGIKPPGDVVLDLEADAGFQILDFLSRLGFGFADLSMDHFGQHFCLLLHGGQHLVQQFLVVHLNHSFGPSIAWAGDAGQCRAGSSERPTR
nr:MAG TPA: hypothetical protein [Caudoviricetes sp.]